MKPRFFHIWDFPEDKIRVSLKDQKKFLLDITKHFGSYKNLASFIGVPQERLYYWINRNLYLPLWALKKIMDEVHLDPKKLEKNIIAYKSISNGKPIINPTLPIKESPELYGIITHLICDGNVSKKGCPCYINLEKNLIDNFMNSLKSRFGEKIHLRLRKNEKRIYVLGFPRFVTDIISHIYNIRYGSLEGNLPKELHELPDKFAVEVIRAIVDDEGAIKDGRIMISMKNKRFLEDAAIYLRRILGSHDSVGKINFKKKEQIWYFGINAQFLKEFEKRISLIHPRKKRDLQYFVEKRNIRKAGEGEYIGNTRLNILELLARKDMNSKEIGQKLYINSSNININLKKLFESELITKLNASRSHQEWRITENGKEFLDLWSFKDKSITIKPINWNKNFNISQREARVKIAKAMRQRLFWMLGKIFKNQENLSNYFRVHRNTINNWKNGRCLIPLRIIDEMILILSNSGVDLVGEIKNNIKEINSINGIYKYYGGKNNGIDILCTSTP